MLAFAPPSPGPGSGLGPRDSVPDPLSLSTSASVFTLSSVPGDMRVPLVVGGAAAVAVGVSTMYVVRHHLDRLDVDREVRDVVRLAAAISTGLLVTVGLVTAVVGLLG